MSESERIKKNSFICFFFIICLHCGLIQQHHRNGISEVRNCFFKKKTKQILSPFIVYIVYIYYQGRPGSRPFFVSSTCAISASSITWAAFLLLHASFFLVIIGAIGLETRRSPRQGLGHRPCMAHTRTHTPAFIMGISGRKTVRFGPYDNGGIMGAGGRG